MQLIPAIILTVSLILLIYALQFVGQWHRAHRNATTLPTLREGIGHIGISAIVEYPDSSAPLHALLEEHYPHSEAIIVIDLQRNYNTFGSLIEAFHLIKCNHTHLRNVRALYRSRQRLFRRVVIIDLPMEHRRQASKVAKEVASYNYALLLRGESIIAHNSLSYCANIIASQPLASDFSMKTVVGATARLERCDTSKCGTRALLTDKILAWRKVSSIAPAIALTAPIILALVSRAVASKLLVLATLATTTTTLLLLLLSCRVVVKKGLFRTFDIIICNFCRYLVERVKNIHYLYKGREREATPAEEVATLNQRETNLEEI